jgi:hypothetical protein
MGCWHGDFGPWNMASGDDGFEVWDWERFSAGVPVGLDAAHYRTQVSVMQQAEPTTAWSVLVREVADVLVRSGQTADAAASVAACYLLVVLARYRADAGETPTPAMQRRMSWLTAAARVAGDRLEVSTR